MVHRAASYRAKRMALSIAAQHQLPHNPASPHVHFVDQEGVPSCVHTTLGCMMSHGCSDGLRSTGWLTHWGEIMANTSGVQMAAGLDGILKYNNSTGSLNFYMAHGGTNFGFWAGATLLRSRSYFAHSASGLLARCSSMSYSALSTPLNRSVSMQHCDNERTSAVLFPHLHCVALAEFTARARKVDLCAGFNHTQSGKQLVPVCQARTLGPATSHTSHHMTTTVLSRRPAVHSNQVSHTLCCHLRLLLQHESLRKVNARQGVRTRSQGYVSRKIGIADPASCAAEVPPHLQASAATTSSR